MAYLPDFLLNSSYDEELIFFNGLFETFFGTLLAIGFYTRLSALLLGLHLFTIIINLGYNDIAVRDFGLALITLSITLRGADKWCLDKKY